MSARHLRVLLAMLFAALLIASVPGSAYAQGSSLFLRITGINALEKCGLSTTFGHVGEIILRGVDANIFRPTDPITGLPVATSVDGRTLKVVKDPDPCSPMLFLTMLQDRSLQEINIFFVRMGTSLEVATIRASDVEVVGIDLASNAGSAPSEVVTLALLGQLQLTVLRINEETGQSLGSTTACWSFAANKRC